MSQAELARLADVQRSAVSEYECGHRAPPRSALSRICRVLRTRPKELQP
jgi:transcriptional regulator with XRE-family HTH domain